MVLKNCWPLQAVTPSPFPNTLPPPLPSLVPSSTDTSAHSLQMNSHSIAVLESTAPLLPPVLPGQYGYPRCARGPQHRKDPVPRPCGNTPMQDHYCLAGLPDCRWRRLVQEDRASSVKLW